MPFLALLFMISVVGTMVLSLIGIWKVFEKADQPGWAVFVPIYNLITFFRIGGRSGWWVLSYLFPPLLIVMLFINSASIAEKFGKSKLFGIGLALPLISLFCWSVLGFGDDVYEGGLDNKYDTQIDNIGRADGDDDEWETETWESDRY